MFVRDFVTNPKILVTIIFLSKGDQRLKSLYQNSYRPSYIIPDYKIMIKPMNTFKIPLLR